MVQEQLVLDHKLRPKSQKAGSYNNECGPFSHKAVSWIKQPST